MMMLMEERKTTARFQRVVQLARERSRAVAVVVAAVAVVSFVFGYRVFV